MAMAPPVTLIRSNGHFRLVHEVQNDRGKCLVDLEKIDIGGSQAGRSSALAVAAGGAVSMMQGSSAALAVDTIFAFGLQSELLRDSSVSDQHDSRAIRDSGRIAGVMHVTNPGNLRIAQPDIIAIIFPDSLESGRQFCQTIGRHIVA